MREPERDYGRLQDIIQAANNIIRMRHVLVHGYATILPELLWHTALVDVPLIKEQIEEIMSGEHSKT